MWEPWTQDKHSRHSVSRMALGGGLLCHGRKSFHEENGAWPIPKRLSTYSVPGVALGTRNSVSRLCPSQSPFLKEFMLYEGRQNTNNFNVMCYIMFAMRNTESQVRATGEGWPDLPSTWELCGRRQGGWHSWAGQETISSLSSSNLEICEVREWPLLCDRHKRHSHSPGCEKAHF